MISKLMTSIRSSLSIINDSYMLTDAITKNLRPDLE